MASPAYYAFTRSLSPQKGQPVLADGTWAGGSPMAEVVVRVLRTPKGTFKPFPSFGVDYTGIDKGLPEATTKLKLAIEAALDSYVKAGRITRLDVKVERAGPFLRYTLTFDDPRLGSNARVTPIRGQF